MNRIAISLLLTPACLSVVQPVHAQDESAETEKTLEYVERMPEFNGNFSAFLSEHLEYPAFANDNGIEGRVVARFVVDATGKVTKLKLVKNAHSTLDSAALRVLRSSPRWKPGTHKGRAVNVYFNQPITFRTEVSGGDVITLDSAEAYFRGPRSKAYDRFPEYAGDVDHDFYDIFPMRQLGQNRDIRYKVLATIGASGVLERASVLPSGHTVLREEALQIVKQRSVDHRNRTRWQPAVKGGKPVSCDVILTVWLKAGQG